MQPQKIDLCQPNNIYNSQVFVCHPITIPRFLVVGHLTKTCICDSFDAGLLPDALPLWGISMQLQKHNHALWTSDLL